MDPAGWPVVGGGARPGGGRGGGVAGLGLRESGVVAVVAREADVADRLLMQHFEMGSQFQRRAAAECGRA